MNPLARSYLSSGQAERIDRILEATNALLVEVGVEKITVRALAERSKVSPATLYNRFGSIDNIISLAVVDRFEKTIQALVESHRGAKSALDKAVFSLKVIYENALGAPAFPRALMRTYYKIQSDRSMPNRLYQALYQTWLPIVEEMHEARHLQSWYPVDRLCGELCDTEMAVMVNWSLGSIEDGRLADRLVFSILAILLGASVGAQLKQVEQQAKILVGRLGKPLSSRGSPQKTRASAAQ